MPIRDVAAQNKSLDNDYGATKGPNAPATHQVALFIGDPMTDGVEVADETEVDDGMGGTIFVPNGYARVSLTNGAAWSAAADGLKSTAAPVEFPTALAEYPDTVTHWALYDAADSTTMWDCAPLTEPLDVTSAGDGPAVILSVFYETQLEE